MTVYQIKRLSLFALFMLITGSVDSIRNLPATALFGSTLVFFLIVSAITFLIPSALVSAELGSTWTKEGGIYNWVRFAFGEKWGFLAVWFQWINTVIWYPTVLSFMAGTLASLFDPSFPSLAQNKFYLVGFILTVCWALTLVNLRGLHVSAKFTSFCSLIGMIIPMFLIIFLAGVWFFLGKPVQVHLTSDDILPHLSLGSENWISLTAIMAAFLGMELTAVHVNRIEDPHKNFPIAMGAAVVFILFTMTIGSLAIAWVLPKDEINLTSGIMQAFTNFFDAFHLSWMIPVIAIMILIGSIGGTINWIISPAKGLLQAAQSGYLPKFFQQENKHGVAANILIVQALIVSVVCLLFLFMPSVNGSYWLLTALTTEVYMIVYVIMFIAAIRLRYKFPHIERPFKIPGGNYGMWIVGLLGLVGCAVTLTVGFFPPSGIDVGSHLRYVVIFTTGLILMVLPIFLFYGYRVFSTKS